MEGDEYWIGRLLLCQRQRPETVIVGVEVPTVDHGINRIDGIEVLCDEDVGLVLGRQDANDFGESSSTGPVVGKGMVGAKAEEGRARVVREGDVGEQEGRGS